MKAALFPVAAAVALLACHDQEVHVFGGYAYDPAQDCLATSGAVDVIAGPDPTGKTCDAVKEEEKTHPRCWVDPGGTAFVVDHGCDAPPDYQDQTTATKGVCVKALEAYGRKGHDRCPTPPDAGSM